jgi:hypothetical protein
VDVEEVVNADAEEPKKAGLLVGVLAMPPSTVGGRRVGAVRALVGILAEAVFITCLLADPADAST